MLFKVVTRYIYIISIISNSYWKIVYICFILFFLKGFSHLVMFSYVFLTYTCVTSDPIKTVLIE